ncbi:pyridine nucleotide-disulfide oxidoreductase-domain-containing protein [Lenzites betulinus]|nr:pyridine nucleotide-disulfide oxidoreductase-domain-containing protein [Lenzites betulinus]
MFSVQRHAVTSTQRLGAPARRTFFGAPTQGKQRLVILGSGWGGYEILRAIDKKRWNVIIVSPSNYFNFTPLLASCAVGTLEFRAAVEPVRRYTPEVVSYTAWCDSIDFKHKKLICMPATSPVKFARVGDLAENTDPNQSASAVEGSSQKFQLTYDKLVIAVGAYSQTFNVPGVKEHAYFLKTSATHGVSALASSNANQPTITDADRRKLLNFCIVGGGPTGVEHYPALARLAKINLYDVAPNILGGFDTGLQEYATSKFRREGIRLLTQHHVERVEKDRMFVTEEGEGREPAGEARYAPPERAHPLLPRSRGHPIQVPKRGSLAYIGDWEAVFDRTKAARGPKGKETGRLAWLLWRSAYFTKTLSVRNKILVPMYWFMNWIFGRDLSRF